MSITEWGDGGRDPAGADVTALTREDVDELQKLISDSGLAGVSLDRRYSVVFVYPGIGSGELYPELAGCTAELCTFADEVTEFVKHGIHLVGLSTQPTIMPGDFVETFPFPVGHLPNDTDSTLIELVRKPGASYATRRSFLVYPDGTGVVISNIKDPVGHVQKCFATAIDRRLAEYRQSALTFFQETGVGVKSQINHTGFLPNGADSVSIATVEFRARLVAKMAAADIVSQEAGYMQRINRLLEDGQRPPVFPAVVAVRTDQRPAYYLMEAADPQSLDHLIFEDDAMTRLRSDRLHLLSGALDRLTNVYRLSFRDDEPAVARYHYLDRFLAIAKRSDFTDTHAFLFGSDASLDKMLRTQFVIDGDYVCRSFHEQVDVLRSHIDALAQPAGAYLHGDVHLKNMLVADDGRSVVFVDPRIVWDGNDVGDPGFGDPLYDFGTLLHSVHVMSCILTAIERGHTASLMTVEEEQGESSGRVITWPGLLRLTGSQTVDWFFEWLNHAVPSDVLGAGWQPRLHVNAANALIGWLKYARAVKTKQAWLAIFAATLYHLERAARQLEDPASQDALT